MKIKELKTHLLELRKLGLKINFHMADKYENVEIQEIIVYGDGLLVDGFGDTYFKCQIYTEDK